MILPSWMWGPGDSAPTAAGKLVLDFLNRKIPGVLDGGCSIVDARDVAQATINAVDRGKSGERYIVGGQYFDLGQVLATLERVTGVPAPTRKIPYGLSLAVGAGIPNLGSANGQPDAADGGRPPHHARQGCGRFLQSDPRAGRDIPAI